MQTSICVCALLASLYVICGNCCTEGPRGPAGPMGPPGGPGPIGDVGAQGIPGRNGSDAVCKTCQYTELTGYNYVTPVTYTLLNAKSGHREYIALANAAVAPVQIKTEQGSYMLRPISTPKSDIIFHGNRWRSLVANTAWYMDELQGGKLLASDTTTNSYTGASVALSADGNTLVEGNDGDNGTYPDGPFGGSVSVFKRVNGTWSQFGPTLIAPDGIGATQGISVAISADGSTIAFGGPDNNTEFGATWVYVLSGGVYIWQASITAPDATVGANQGLSVALSADGNTLAFGGPFNNGSIGATWVYVRSAGVWSYQAILVGSGGTAGDVQGADVAISADGNTIAVGAPEAEGGYGETYVFSRTGVTWTEEALLVGGGGVGPSSQGLTISLGALGDTLAIGGTGADNGGIGAAWVFVRTNTPSGKMWTQQGPKITGTGATGTAGQGNGVCLSAGGNTLLIGGPTDNGDRGAVWVFTRVEDTWVQVEKLVYASAGTDANLGLAMAMDADGTTAALGIGGNNGGEGGVVVFV